MEFESKGILASRSVVSTLCLVDLSQSVGSNVDEMKKRHWSRHLDAILLLPSQLTAWICSVFCDLGILLGKKKMFCSKRKYLKMTHLFQYHPFIAMEVYSAI